MVNTQKYKISESFYKLQIYIKYPLMIYQKFWNVYFVTTFAIFYDLISNTKILILYIHTWFLITIFGFLFSISEISNG